MCETDFSNAKVGDRVWSVEYGWGEIYQTSISSACPLSALFKNSVRETYTIDGCRNKNVKQTLFYDEIKITPPPRPKRKVRKEVKVWANIYSSYNVFHDSKEEAVKAANPARIASGVELTGSYEVEE